MDEFEILAREILGKLRLRLGKVGVALHGQLFQMATDRKMMAKENFRNNMSYAVEETDEGLVLRLGSNVEHAEYVLGGKEPSGTPYDKLEEWIKDKGLVWYRRRKKKEPLKVKMKTKQMIFLIERKHLEKGIEARNIVQEVVDERADWIMQELKEVIDEYSKIL